MNNPSKILLTCPGKLGDLLYSLPLALGIKQHFRAEIVYQTSPLCRAAEPLLAVQPYLAGTLVDESYRLEAVGLGYQPWKMAQPTGFDLVFHLGLRPDFVRDLVFRQYLGDTFLHNFNLGYGFSPQVEQAGQYLFLPDEPVEPFIAFHGFGETISKIAQPEVLTLMDRYWRELFRRTGLKVVGLAGPDQPDPPPGLVDELVKPADLLECAGIIKRAACFAGLESGPAAVANGLKTPRLVLDFVGNSLPTGPNGDTFRLDEPFDKVAAKLGALLEQPRT